MSKVLVDRELLERTVKHLEWDGDGSQTVMQYAQQGDSLANELMDCIAQPAEAEGVELQRLAAEFDAAPDDAEWEPPHPIFQMARDLDRVTAALSAVTAEGDRLRSENDRLRSGVRGDFDLDAWLDWSRESDQLRTDLRALRYLVGQCVDYLNIGRQSSITNGSILHRTMAVAVEGK